MLTNYVHFPTCTYDKYKCIHVYIYIEINMYKQVFCYCKIRMSRIESNWEIQWVRFVLNVMYHVVSSGFQCFFVDAGELGIE